MKSSIFFFVFLFTFLLNGQNPYSFDLKKEGLVLGGSALMVGGSLFIDQRRATLSVDDIINSVPDVPRFDRIALGYNSIDAENASDFLLFASTALPLSMLASKKLRGQEMGYLLMYGQTIALNGGLTFLIKSATNRRRPYFYNPIISIDERLSLQARKSFFSGHVSHTAALSFFTAQIYADCYPESKWKSVVWTGAVLLPVATSYLRVRAGKHFPTDVIVGYGMGAVVGILVPRLHTIKSASAALKIVPIFNGVAITYEF